MEKTEDVLNRGDITRVKLLSIDEKGRLRLSRKAALAEDAAGGAGGAHGDADGGDGGDDEGKSDEGKSEEAQG